MIMLVIIIPLTSAIPGIEFNPDGSNGEAILPNIAFNPADIQHNDLGGLQGGSPDEFFHMNETIYDKMMDQIYTWINNTVSDLTNYYNKEEINNSFVPYSGATQELDLGDENMTASSCIANNGYFSEDVHTRDLYVEGLLYSNAQTMGYNINTGKWRFSGGGTQSNSYNSLNSNTLLTISSAGFTTGGRTAIDISTSGSQSSGDATSVLISPTYTTTSTSGSTDFQILRTETSVGSGAQYLFRAGTEVSENLFTISNDGFTSIDNDLNVTGNITASDTLTNNLYVNRFMYFGNDNTNMRFNDEFGGNYYSLQNDYGSITFGNSDDPFMYINFDEGDGIVIGDVANVQAISAWANWINTGTFQTTGTLTAGNIVTGGTISATNAILTGTQFLAPFSDVTTNPGHSWTTDTDTGMFRAGPNIIGWATNALERARLSNTLFSTNVLFQAENNLIIGKGLAGTINYLKFDGENNDFWMKWNGTEKLMNMTGGNVNIDKGNMTADNVFLPALLYHHTNHTLPVEGAGEWVNITFDNEPSEITIGILHTHDVNNYTFTIVEPGKYKLSYDNNFQDSSATPPNHILSRVLKNNEELIGSLEEKDSTKQNADFDLDKLIYAVLVPGDVIIFQFTSDSTTVSLTTHATYGDHISTSEISIEKVMN